MIHIAYFREGASISQQRHFARDKFVLNTRIKGHSEIDIYCQFVRYVISCRVSGSHLEQVVGELLVLRFAADRKSIGRSLQKR